MIVNANMKNVIVKNSDILYFVPKLIKQAFFRNSKNVTTFTGIVNGPMNKLYGKDLRIKTGVNTILKTDFFIAGLPDVKTASFNFPNLYIRSGKTDIKMIADTSIPKTIELPEKY
jgi:hypothetical protein